MGFIVRVDSDLIGARAPSVAWPGLMLVRGRVDDLSLRGARHVEPIRGAVHGQVVSACLAADADALRLPGVRGARLPGLPEASRPDCWPAIYVVS